MVHWFMVGFMMKKVQIISLRLRVRNYPIIHLLVNLPSIVLPGRDRQHQIYVKFQGKTSWPGFADMMPLLYIIIGPSKELTDDHQDPTLKVSWFSVSFQGFIQAPPLFILFSLSLWKVSKEKLFVFLTQKILSSIRFFWHGRVGLKCYQSW